MKSNSLYKRSLLTVFIAGLLCSVLFIACKKDTSNNTSAQMYNTSGNASGAQENPPVSSSGTGTLTGTYNAATNAWQYNISWSTISDVATAVEIHGPADVGANGTLMLTLMITTAGITGNANGNVTLTEQQETDLLAGKCYYTILTATHLTGEIRGQITATAQ